MSPFNELMIILITVQMTGSESQADVVDGGVYIEGNSYLNSRGVSIEWHLEFSSNSLIRDAATDEDTLVPSGSVLRFLKEFRFDERWQNQVDS